MILFFLYLLNEDMSLKMSLLHISLIPKYLMFDFFISTLTIYIV
jgi:hypothetical protein